MTTYNPGTVNVTYLTEVVPERIEWYWPGRIAKGKLTCTDGDPGLGKTTAMLDVAARFSRGWPMPNEFDAPPITRVAVLSDEDGLADTIVPRLNIAGADLSNICQLTGTSIHGFKRSLTVPEDMKEIIAIVRGEGIGLLYVDPLAAHASSTISLYNDQEVRTQVMGPLAGLGEETGVAVVLVRHPTKQTGMPALYRGGGSMGIIGAARFGLLIGKDPHDESRRVIASTKANIGPPPLSIMFQLEGVEGTDHARVKWDPIPSTLTADDLSSAPPSTAQKARGDAQQWLVEYLVGGAKPAEDTVAAAEDAGHAKRTLDRAKKELGVESKKTYLANIAIWYWCLPGQQPPQTAATPEQTDFVTDYPQNGRDSYGWS